MSSLLQFSGKVSRKGVHLQFYQTIPNTADIAGLGPIYKDMPTSGQAVETVVCSQCQKSHPRIFTVARKPKGMFGQWVVFRYNGKDNVPDLSCPIAEFRLPRDAKPVTDEQNTAIWHSA